MDETDAFFTHTIVGAPFSVLMGRRLDPAELRSQGLDIDRHTGAARLNDAWQDWWVLSHASDAPGRPRCKPGRLRLWLERHALWLALGGLSLTVMSAFFWLVKLWV